MNLGLTFTIIIAKTMIKACRFAKWGGTTLPGKFARKIYPDILQAVTKDFKIIMVTGTNGKTTTTRIIGQILKENGIKYISNKSGANLISGITSAFIESVNFSNRSRIPVALIEVDEAAFDAAGNYLRPDILVITNFFRDQLDRYGELYTTLKGVSSGIRKLKNTKLVLNADDSLCASLGKDTANEVIYYGISSYAYKTPGESINSDAIFCIYCKNKYVYSSRVYEHLGFFKCEKCGYERPDTQITCTNVTALTSSCSHVRISIDYPAGQETNGQYKACHSLNARINLPGVYNIYNSLAAVACGCSLELPPESSIKALGNFECGFGRLESINIAGKYIKVILVKNPAGFNQVLDFLLTEARKMQVAFIINDKLADGTDISWLWDVDFEKLQRIQAKLENIYTSGIRAEDMALRLKYAGMNTGKITIVKDYDRLINTALAATAVGHSFYILPTYTAMLDIRKALKRKFGLKEFWK